MASIAYKDYEQRRERQAQGIAKAKAKGKFLGRKPDFEKYKKIAKLAEGGLSYREIVQTMNCSQRTISNAIKWSKKQTS